MEQTKNFGLRKPSTAETLGGFLSAHNANMDDIDKLPLPVAAGSNSQLSYFKFSDGTLFVWGMVDYGTRYPCTNQVATASGYASANFTLNFPVAMATDGYAFIPSVAADKNPDMSVAVSSRTLGGATCSFVCPLNDGSAPNSKKLSVLAVGRWR